MKSRHHSEDLKKTAQKIAKRTKVSKATVERAEKFADDVDKVAKNTGIGAQKILSGEIKATRKDINVVSKISSEHQKRVFEKIENKVVKNVKQALKEVKHLALRPS